MHQISLFLNHGTTKIRISLLDQVYFLRAKQKLFEGFLQKVKLDRKLCFCESFEKSKYEDLYFMNEIGNRLSN